MEYLFGGSSSKNSVVDHAQKVVADLEVALKEKDEKVSQLQVSTKLDVCDAVDTVYFE